MTINLSQSLVVTGVGGFDEWKIEKKKKWISAAHRRRSSQRPPSGSFQESITF